MARTDPRVERLKALEIEVDKLRDEIACDKYAEIQDVIQKARLLASETPDWWELEEPFENLLDALGELRFRRGE